MNSKLTRIALGLTLTALLIPATGCDLRGRGHGPDYEYSSTDFIFGFDWLPVGGWDEYGDEYYYEDGYYYDDGYYDDGYYDDGYYDDGYYDDGYYDDGYYDDGYYDDYGDDYYDDFWDWW